MSFCGATRVNAILSNLCGFEEVCSIIVLSHPHMARVVFPQVGLES